MTEEWDIAPRTPEAVKKHVTWVTDRYGYRIANSDVRTYPVVIVGDSTILGTGLDQPETPAAVLRKKLRLPVYPYAPYYEMETFLADPRFQKNPPRTVIFTMMEWAMPDMTARQIPAPPPNPVFSRMRNILSDSNYTRLGILLDRISKQSFFHFLEAQLRRGLKAPLGAAFLSYEINSQRILFPKGKNAHPEIGAEEILPIAAKIRFYKEILKARGIHFIFLPVPNKETVYYPIIKQETRPFLHELIGELKKEKISVVDSLTALDRDFAARHRLLYQTDDTHWNADGVEVLMEETASVLKTQDPSL